MNIFNKNRCCIFFIALLFQIPFLVVSSSLFAAEKPVIIVFKEKPGDRAVGKVKFHKGKIKRIHPFIKAISVTLPEEEIVHLTNDSQVAYIQEDVILSLPTVPENDEFTASWGVGRIGSLAAHQSGIKGKGVKVAVLDTGIDYMHEEFARNYKGGYDFVFEDDDPYDDSYNSHGTHVSGIIAAEVNGTGIVGVAPETSLYAIKVLDGGGFGMLSDILSGIEWAVENKMDILNLSFGSIFYIPLLEEACNKAYDSGVLLVAATGNSRGGPVGYPARHPSVVGVSAIDIENNISTWASIGPEVELVAPGINILSTMAAEKGNYGYLHGSSQAAPHVTGAAALLISSGTLDDLNGDGFKDQRDVRLALLNNTLDLGEPGFDTLYGNGMIRIPDFNIVDQFTLVAAREKKKDVNGYEVNLIRGSYNLNIENNDLSFLRIFISEKMSDGKVKKRSNIYNFMAKGDIVNVTLDISGKEATLEFYPIGKVGSSASIIIIKK